MSALHQGRELECPGGRPRYAGPYDGGPATEPAGWPTRWSRMAPRLRVWRDQAALAAQFSRQVTRRDRRRAHRGRGPRRRGGRAGRWAWSSALPVLPAFPGRDRGRGRWSLVGVRASSWSPNCTRRTEPRPRGSSPRRMRRLRRGRGPIAAGCSWSRGGLIFAAGLPAGPGCCAGRPGWGGPAAARSPSARRSPVPPRGGAVQPQGDQEARPGNPARTCARHAVEPPPGARGWHR